MKISDEQKTKYSAFMQDLWGLIKEFRNPEQADAYWKELVDKTTAISKKYDNDELAMNLLMAFCDTVDKEQKNKIG